MPPTSTPRIAIVYRPLSDIKRLPNNVKRHDLESIIESLSEFGMLDPIGVNDKTGNDYDGNGRADALEIMKERGMPPPKFVEVRRVKVEGKMVNEWFVPTIAGASMDKWTEARAAIGLNRTNEKGGIDEPLLAKVLNEMQERKASALRGTGYTDDDLRSLLLRVSPPTGDPPAPGENGDARAKGSASDPPPPSHVRMFQLFLNDKTQPVFLEQVSALLEHKRYADLDNATDLIVKLVTDAYNSTHKGRA